MPVDIGHAIKEGLKKKGKTQTWLAETMGKYSSAISAWIANKKKPYSTDLIKLAELLDIVDELFPLSSFKEVLRTERKLLARENQRLAEIRNALMEGEGEECIVNALNLVDQFRRECTDRISEILDEHGDRIKKQHKGVMATETPFPLRKSSEDMEKRVEALELRLAKLEKAQQPTDSKPGRIETPR